MTVVTESKCTVKIFNITWQLHQNIIWTIFSAIQERRKMHKQLNIFAFEMMSTCLGLKLENLDLLTGFSGNCFWYSMWASSKVIVITLFWTFCFLFSESRIIIKSFIPGHWREEILDIYMNIEFFIELRDIFGYTIFFSFPLFYIETLIGWSYGLKRREKISLNKKMI